MCSGKINKKVTIPFYLVAAKILSFTSIYIQNRVLIPATLSIIRQLVAFTNFWDVRTTGRRYGFIIN